MELKEWQQNRLWYVDMTCSRFGLQYIHRMVIIKINGDSLIIHSPFELTTSLQSELSKLGKVVAVVTPSPDYHQYLSEWWLTYPDALFYATPTSIQKRSDLNFDGALSNTSPEIWKHELFQTSLSGIHNPRKMIFCDPGSRTLILSNNLLAVQKEMPLGQKAAIWLRGANKELKLPYSDKRHIENPAQLRASVQEIMTWPFERLLSSNGLIYRQNAKEAFYQAFWWAF